MSPLEFRHVTLLLLPIQVFEVDIFFLSFLRKSIVASQYIVRTRHEACCILAGESSV